MSNFTEKMRVFAEARANGVKPKQAAMLAGYKEGSAAAQASRLQARDDIRKMIATLKKGGGKSDDGRVNPFDMRLKDHYDTPLDFMLDCMNNKTLLATLRFEAAKQALPYVNPRVEAKGKKRVQKDAAHDVAKGKYKPKKAPPLPAGVADMQARRRA